MFPAVGKQGDALNVKYNIRMCKRLILGIWLVGIVFPAIWLRQFSNTYRRVFDHLFAQSGCISSCTWQFMRCWASMLMLVFRLPS